MSIKAPAWPPEYQRLVLAEVDSTNAEAQRRAGSLSGPCWILGLRQTAGRGRRGRAWVDPAGNLAATLVMRLNDDPSKMALRSFTAALALRDALVQVTGLEEAFALKWPNDVLLNGGKFSGILLESVGQGVLALGIGANLHSAPPADPDAAFAPVSLRAETGITITPEQFLDYLGPAFADWEQRLQTYGFAPVRDAFLRHVARLGEPLIARTHSEEIHGVFDTIDDTGALVMTSPKGSRTVPAADIYFP